ncbi:MAG: Trk system potassium transporter TrkA [Acidobacteria bacterium]|nr:Trk system potassium transporter TrkA [Acidobacteriota bacterium]
MRITIVGGGEIGFAISQALSIEHEVSVIDRAADVAERFEALDVQFVRGRATSPGVLERAGVAQADVLVACTGLDEVNIVACAIASRLGKPRTFCFVSREEFLGLHDDKGLDQFGIDRVVWPEAQLASDIERIIRVPGALDAETFVDGAIQMVEYRLDPESELPGRSIAELHLPHGSLIVAVRRGDAVFIPRGESTLAFDDRIVVIGTPEALRDVTERVTVAAGARRQRVTIIGGGAVGLRIATLLEAADATDVTVIESDPGRGEALAGRLRRTLILNGDGTDLELLESEDVGRSDVLVSVIDNDERNLFASLLGRQLGVRRIITRVSKRANLRLFEHVGIDVAVSARGAAVASVLHQIQGSTTRLLAVVEQGAGRILELDIPEGYVSRSLRDLAPPLNSIVGAIVRGTHVVIPRGADRIQAGDRLIVFTTHEAADQVRKYFANVKSQS